MKSTVLVRPNLKLFLLGALLIAVLHDLAFNGPSTASGLSYTASLAHLSESGLAKLLERAEAEMNPELYMKVSYAYEKRGEPKKALFYLRKAEECYALYGAD